MIAWSRLAGMKFCLVLPGSRQCLKLFINYILWLHVKSFIPARREPSFVLPQSCFAGTKFSRVIASTCLSGIKKLMNTSVWKKIIEVHLKRFTRERLASQLAKVSSKIFLLYFYDECDVNLWEKKLTNEISSFYESMGFRELTCLQRKIKRKFIQMYTNAWWKTVPPCRDEV